MTSAKVHRPDRSTRLVGPRAAGLLFCFASALARAVWAQGDPATDASSEPAAAASAYDRHFDEAMRRFEREDYEGAIAEFEQAYVADPLASPLINIALSYKKLDERSSPPPHAIPRAIEALRTAVAKHADSMKPGVRETVETEIEALTASLRTLTIVVDPEGADLRINGISQPLASRKRIPLRARSWVVEARAEGYAPERRDVKLITEPESTLRLQLRPTTGVLRVRTRDPLTLIEVSGRSSTRQAQGKWEGRVEPGLYDVRVTVPGLIEDSSSTLAVDVVAGRIAIVTQNEDGLLESAAAASEAASSAREGVYLLGSGAVLLARGAIPTGCDRVDPPAKGPALGARAGYRVASWVGFEGAVQLGAIFGKLECAASVDPLSSEKGEAEYTLGTLRLGGMMRFWVPGSHWVRFVASPGGGLAIDKTWFTEDAGELWQAVNQTLGPASGLDFFAQVDLGVEFELDQVLLSAVIQNTVQSTHALATGDQSTSPFEDRPIYAGGLALHVGYGFW